MPYGKKWYEQSTTLELPPKEAGTWISCRYFIVYLGFLGLSIVYVLRVNPSVVILSMIKTNHSYYTTTKEETYLTYNSSNKSTQIGTTCKTSVQHDLQVKETPGEKFNWDEKTQGLILGAFYYGNIITTLPGGYLASRFGGKWLFGGAILMDSVLTLFIPLIAKYSLNLLITVRIIQGLGDGVIFPAVHEMISRWVPSAEISFLVSLWYNGWQFGTVIAQPISGYICESRLLGGWPATFYIYGLAGVIWCCIWFSLTSSSPQDHPNISKVELAYIERSIPPVKYACY